MRKAGGLILDRPSQHIDHAALVARAVAARRHAYCPYSGFAVGAAVLARDGRVFTGCNIENAAYSDTICAERVALFKAVSEGCGEIAAIAVVAAGETGPRPCGSCLQVLAELAPCAAILLATPGGEYRRTDLGALLPQPFRLPARAAPEPAGDKGEGERSGGK